MQITDTDIIETFAIALAWVIIGLGMLLIGAMIYISVWLAFAIAP